MVYTRYIKRGENVYGPYRYSSRKEGEKVISEYIGKGAKEEVVKEKKRKFNIYLLIFAAVGVLLLFFFLLGKTNMTGKVSFSSLPSPTLIGDGQWELTHTTDDNYAPYIANSKDKKTILGLIPNNGICPIETKQLYNRNGELILDNKAKIITLKCESSKCGGKNCYSISLTDARAINIDDYVKIGLESTTYEWINSTLYIYDTDFYDQNGFEIEVYLNDSKVQTPNMKWIEKNPTENKIEFYPNLSGVKYPLESISFKVNGLAIQQETTKINQYSSIISKWVLDFSKFESKNKITSKIITPNTDEDGNILSYLISYYGTIWDLDPTLELAYDSSDDLNFQNITEGSTSGARISAPVLYMNFNKPSENLTTGNYINGSKDYVQDNSVYNNKGDVGNLLDNGMWVGGNLSNGLEFDGVNDYVLMSSSGVLTEGYSIFTWIKYYGGGTAAAAIVGNYMLHVQTSTNKLSSSPNQTAYLSTGALTEGVWTHVGVTCNNLTETSQANLTFYINGIQSGSYNVSRCNWLTSSLYIGQYGATSTFYLNGILDELYRYNRSINQTEITELYTNNTVLNSTGLIWQLPFNETSGTTALNTANYSNNGTLTNYRQGSPTYNSSCTAFTGSEGCYEFGSNDYLSISSDLVSTNEVTISAWIYLTSISDETIYSNNNWFLYRVSGGRLALRSNSTFTAYSDVGSISTNTWYNVVAIRKRGVGKTTFYINGILSGTSDQISGVPLTGTINYIGSNQAIGSYFDGSIDDVRIWNRALSSDEINTLYSDTNNQGKYSKSGDFKSTAFYNSTSVYWNTTFSMANSSGQEIDLTDVNLVGYWKFDENYLDSKSTNYGTCITCPSNATGLSSDALYFDGVDDYVATSPLSLDSTLNQSTLSLWIYPKYKNALQPILSDNVQVGTAGFLLLYMPTNSYNLTYQYANGTSYNLVTATNILNGYTDRWVHILITADYNNRVVSFYRNGDLYYLENIAYPMLYPTSNRTRYFGRYSSSSTLIFKEGMLDEILIYNDTLTSTEIRDLYKTGLSQHASTNIALQTRTASTYNLTDPGLVSFWSFNSNESGNATDEKYLNNGTGGSMGINGANDPTWNESYGLVGGGYYFDGVNDQVNVTDSNSLDFGTNNFTISVWINPKDLTTITGIIDNSGSGVGLNEWGIWSGYSALDQCPADKPCFIFSNDANTDHALGFPSVSSTGRWYNLVIIRNGTDSFATYTNGVLEQIETGFGTTTLTDTLDIYIGTLGVGYFFNGSIDEVRIYNRSLLASEVLDLYELGNTHISDWSAWSGATYMNYGTTKTSNTLGKFFQFRALFETNNTEVSPYLFNHSVGFGGILSLVSANYSSHLTLKEVSRLNLSGSSRLIMREG